MINVENDIFCTKNPPFGMWCLIRMHDIDIKYYK